MPTHFGISGAADDWSTRATAVPAWFFISFVAWLVAIAGYAAFMRLVRYRAPGR